MGESLTERTGAGTEPGIETFLSQVAHRGIAVAILMLVVRAALFFFDRMEGGAYFVLPYALGFEAVAAASAVGWEWTARRAGRPAREARRVFAVAVVMLVLTGAWMLRARLSLLDPF